MGSHRDRDPTLVWATVVVLVILIVTIGNWLSTTDNEVRLECVKHQPLAECKDVR
jgi:hypothetical protein